MMTDWEEKYKQERAARQEAQLQLVEYKELLARARLDVMRQLKEQDWTPEWHAPAERLVKWMHCMSYNDSYFGEPAGYLKQCVNELRHLLPPHELKAVPQQCTYPECGCREDLGTDWMACKP